MREKGANRQYFFQVMDKNIRLSFKIFFCFRLKNFVALTVVYFCFVPVQSIFTVPGIHLSKDPGYRSSAFPQSSGKSRRQSMLLWLDQQKWFSSKKKVKNRSKYFKATLQWRQNSSRLFSAFVLLYFFLIINNNIIHCYTFSSLRKIYTLFVFLIVLFRISLFFIVIVRRKNIPRCKHRNFIKTKNKLN